jgi:hypothetical protein
MIPRVIRMTAVMGLSASMSIGSIAQGAEGSGITLAVTSPEGGATPFRATCTISGPDGERSEAYERTTPMDLTFEGAKGLRCRLESAGAIEVTARGPGGNVSHTRTSGGTITLSLGL